jgi:hypothetical protein
VYKYFGSLLLLVAGAYFIYYLGNLVSWCAQGMKEFRVQNLTTTPSPSIPFTLKNIYFWIKVKDIRGA